MIKCTFCKYDNDLSNDCDYWGCDKRDVTDIDHCAVFHMRHGQLTRSELIEWLDLERKKAIVDEDLWSENHFSWLLRKIKGNPRELRELILLWHSETDMDLKDKVNESIKELKESGKA